MSRKYIGYIIAFNQMVRTFQGQNIEKEEWVRRASHVVT
jgi:hypothetical protein